MDSRSYNAAAGGPPTWADNKVTDEIEMSPLDTYYLYECSFTFRVFVYRYRIDEGRLKHSLSMLLSTYPILAGRVSK
eukprot:evm.model.scf_467.7 EVM.evm.TU.scf_467.7   scf_467:67759-69441(+)